VTVDEIAARAGLPASRVTRTLLAAGIPARHETEVPADLVSVMAAFEQGADLMGEEAILAFTRVLGAAANNVAEAAVALFFAQMGPGTAREGPDELALLVMDAFGRAQRRAEAARSWLGSSPPANGEAEGPTEVVALGFVDLVGSTAWGERLPCATRAWRWPGSSRRPGPVPCSPVAGSSRRSTTRSAPAAAGRSESVPSLHGRGITSGRW